MLKATGLNDADLEKPLIAVANTWTDATPCNLHLRELGAKVKEGIRAAGGTPIEFNTVVVSDGISMGTEGMRASLVSREVIADSIELAVRGAMCDGVVALSGCDKTIPGTMMALARLDLPGLMLYGGSIMPGKFRGKDVTIQDVFEGIGAQAAGRISLVEPDQDVTLIYVAADVEIYLSDLARNRWCNIGRRIADEIAGRLKICRYLLDHRRGNRHVDRRRLCIRVCICRRTRPTARHQCHRRHDQDSYQKYFRFSHLKVYVPSIKGFLILLYDTV